MSARPEWWSSDEWATPPALVAGLEAEFGVFDLDPCCRRKTAKASRFYTKAKDGLRARWDGRVFLNPPYSRPAPWLSRAIEHDDLVVALLPVRTDTGWFHDLVLPNAALRFIRGRVKFLGWEGTAIPNPKDPHMLAIFNGSSRVGTCRTLRQRAAEG